MKFIAIVLISVLFFPLISCSTAKNAFDTSKVKAGMHKKDVVEQLGKPYKTEFFTNEYDEVIERYQYARFFLGNPYEIYYLEFRNDRLISLHSPLAPALQQQPTTAPLP